jgi:integrase
MDRGDEARPRAVPVAALRGYSSSHTNKQLIVVRGLYRLAWADGVLPRNLAAGLRGAKGRDARLGDALTLEEARAVIDAIGPDLGVESRRLIALRDMALVLPRRNSGSARCLGVPVEDLTAPDGTRPRRPAVGRSKIRR